MLLSAIKTKCKKLSFTLAEVLITLTIIGVIAAITIPNLMQSWRKHERITQIKTAYSIIQNAVKMSVAENGSTDGWAYSDSLDFTEKYIVPYLKIQKKCGMTEYSTKFIQSGCFYYDKNDSASRNGTWFFLNGKTSSKTGSGGYSSVWSYTMKLQNGMDLGVLALNGISITFIFDVNGTQGPTMAGNDVFAFTLNPATGKFSTGQTYAWTGDIYHCKTTSRHGGMYCAHDIELNHWEFPDDYPIKKF